MKTKPKKAGSANLEKNRIIYFETGIVIALVITLIAFEWATPENDQDNYLMTSGEFTEQLELPQVTRREIKKPLATEKLKIATIFNEVDNDVEVEEFDVYDPEIYADDEPYYYPEPEEEGFGDEVVDFFVVEDKPLFMGEKPDIAFTRYISGRVEYPVEASENGIGGRVVLQFVIDEEGRLTDIEVYSGIHPSLDSAAVQAVRSSPRWTPGKQREKPVKVRYTFPVSFTLQ